MKVTINELDDSAVCDIQTNCQKNGFTVCAAGEVEPQGLHDVEIVTSDANVIMHQRQFNFV